MSFYRTIITAVAALGLATSVFADDATTTTTTTTPADSSAATTTQATTDTSAAATTTTTTTEATAEKVNVNTATAKELAKVKGLSSAQAKAIVFYRKKHGEFKSLDDLKMVKGLKKMNDEKMKGVQDQLTTG